MRAKILISVDPYEARAALMEGTDLLNIEVEAPTREKKKGNVYRAKVLQREPSLEAFFVDIGEGRDGFLSYTELNVASLRGLSGAAATARHPRIGDYVVAQVSREALGGNGVSLTMNVSLPGRFLVLLPFADRRGVSRKLSPEERERMRSLLRGLDVPKGMGVVARSAMASVASLQELEADLKYLMEAWNTIEERYHKAKGPGLLRAEEPLAVRFVRDYMTSDVTEILVEDEQSFGQIEGYLRRVAPAQARLVKPYRDPIPLFSRYGVDSQVESLLHNRIELPCGGSIVINETEALVAIDVNSGKLKDRDVESTAFATNLEAAKEIARQIVLRDLGGLIVVDFIDMGRPEHNQAVVKELREALATDKARITFGETMEFGLLVLTRQRLREGLDSALTVTCPHCRGTGRIRSPQSVGIAALRKLRHRLASSKESRSYFELVLSPSVADFVSNRRRDVLSSLEQQYGCVVDVRADSAMRPSEYKIKTSQDLPEGVFGSRQQEQCSQGTSDEREAQGNRMTSTTGEEAEQPLLAKLLKHLVSSTSPSPPRTSEGPPDTHSDRRARRASKTRKRRRQ